MDSFEIEDEIRNIPNKKKAGSDDMLIKTLKYTAKYTIEPFRNEPNQCVEKGIVPSVFKKVY